MNWIPKHCTLQCCLQTEQVVDGKDNIIIVNKFVKGGFQSLPEIQNLRFTQLKEMFRILFRG